MKIEPCPFCGNNEISYHEDNAFRWGYAMCTHCEARAPEIRKNYGESSWNQWQSLALEVWNDRINKEQKEREEKLIKAAWNIALGLGQYYLFDEEKDLNIIYKQAELEQLK